MFVPLSDAKQLFSSLKLKELLFIISNAYDFLKVKIQPGQSSVENLTLFLYRIIVAAQWVTSNVLLSGKGAR